MRVKIYGPPGTGKTTTLHRVMDYALGLSFEAPFPLPESFPTDLKPKNIAFVSFTNTAIDVIGKRTGITPRSKEAPYMRTIHGLILSALSEYFDPTVVNNLGNLADVQAEFAKKMGYYYSKDPFEFAEGNMKFNHITRALEIYLPKTGDVEEALKMIDDPEDRKFALAWYRYKRKKKLMDFDDILLTGYEHLEDFYIPVDVVIIDEGQDNGPLDYLLLEKGFEGAKYIFLAGDPLQSIYGFKGADPRLFVGWKADKEVVLGKSYRLPKRVWLLSQSWALHLGIKGTAVHYEPDNREGKVRLLKFKEALTYAVESAKRGKSVLILARTNSLVKFVGNILSIEYGVAYGHLKRASYWESHLLRFIEGLQMLKLWDGKTPIKVQDTKPITGLIRKLKDKHAREVLRKWRDSRQWNLEVQAVLQKIKKNPSEYFYITDFDRQALKAYFSKARLNLTEELIIDTIHAAKGEEADVVIFFDFIPARSEERINPKELQEKLVAYVGFTRAREELIIVPTPTIKYHPMREFMGAKHILSVVNSHKHALIEALRR